MDDTSQNLLAIRMSELDTRTYPYAAFAAWLREAAKRVGADRRELQKNCNVSYTAAHNWWTGRHLPHVKYSGAIAATLEMQTHDVRQVILEASFDRSGVARQELSSVTFPKPLLDLPAQAMPAGSPEVSFESLGGRSVPVLGTVVGGDEADFHIDGGPVAYVRKPEAIANLAEVYALYVVGDSMYPRFKDGELVYVHKRTPSIGDDVVVQLKPLPGDSMPRGFIKFLVKRTSTAWVCGQYNPDIEIHFSRDDIVSVDRILKLHELLGI